MRPARSRSCCPSSRASSTATPSGCRSRPVRSPTSSSTSSATSPRTRSTRRSRPPRRVRSRICVYTEERSSPRDIVTGPRAARSTAGCTLANGNQVKVVGWYDNEWGYSNRLIDLAGSSCGRVRCGAGSPRPWRTTIDDRRAAGGLSGKRILVRSDLNVPLDGGTITDDGRIRASVPTIRACSTTARGVIVMAHLGRPEGRTRGPASRWPRWPPGSVNCSAAPVAASPSDHGGGTARGRPSPARPGGSLLENVRFDAARDQQGRRRARRTRRRAGRVRRRLRLRRVRSRASQARERLRRGARLPHAAGELVAAEIEVMRRLTEDPARPYVVVLGGAKVSDKLGVIDNLLAARSAADRRRDGVHLPCRAGPRRRQEPARADQIDAVKGTCADHGDKIVSARPTSSSAAAVPADAEHGGPGRRHRPEDRRSRHRTGVGTCSSPTPRRGARPCSGTARWASRRSTSSRVELVPWPRRSPRSTACRSWVAATRPRRSQPGLRRGRVRSHLDRWGREPRVPRGQDPSRPCGVGGLDSGSQAGRTYAVDGR